MNYPSIFEGFMAKGIVIEDIRPRENVFTFWAWQALGRRVRKGEHGVKATTFVAVAGKRADEPTDDSKGKAGYRMPRTVTVFHVSQTDPIVEVAQ
jgi:antirestriction protein ArdC